LLDATAVAAKRALRYASSKQNRSIASLRTAELLLLLPPAEFHVYGFFQRQNIEKIWRETMAASGFGEELTRRVIVDAFPRAGKQGHAYMSPARMAILLQPQVDGTTLDFIRPPDESELWGKPVTAIVQNFTDDDLGNVKTAFHEGGHGLDFASRREISGNYHSNGYSETHSTTMERFARDLEFLKNYAINAQGERPAPGKIEQYLREEVINELLVFRGSVIQSLFDIELWRHDYSKPGSPKLWERAIKLSKELALRQRFVPVPKDLVKMRGLSYFSTSHFYSGEVRYFGYVLAKVAAETVANHALDRLEAETGRRTLFQQPKLGPMLTQLYRYGTETKFPESIERFTGKTFSAVEFARDLNAGVHMGLDVMEKEAVSTACDNALATNRAPAP
ncbi:MAG: M3 family metallopeptidase, partial [Bdellovibrionales bacterium]